MSAFLRFIVERTLAGDAAAIKGYTIGTQALGRDASFDPQTDPIVRVEAGRLRNALTRYYADRGVRDTVRIALPRGSYVPLFCIRDSGAAADNPDTPPRSSGGIAPAGADPLAAVTALVGLHQTSVLRAVSTLDDLSGRLLAARNLAHALDEVLAATIRLQAADFGTVQLLDAGAQALVIVAERGFGDQLLSLSGRISADATCASGRALRSGAAVTIEDVDNDPAYAPYRCFAANAGYRAVHATPLISSDGDVVGALTTHFRRPHAPSRLDVLLTAIYSRLAADVLARLGPGSRIAPAPVVFERLRSGQR